MQWHMLSNLFLAFNTCDFLLTVADPRAGDLLPKTICESRMKAVDWPHGHAVCLTSTTEVIFPVQFVCPSVFYAKFHKNEQPDFHRTWWKDETRAKEEPLSCFRWNQMIVLLAASVFFRVCWQFPSDVPSSFMCPANQSPACPLLFSPLPCLVFSLYLSPVFLSADSKSACFVWSVLLSCLFYLVIVSLSSCSLFHFSVRLLLNIKLSIILLAAAPVLDSTCLHSFVTAS